MAEYSISQLSKEFDVTTRTIRHYEELDLLMPARRGQTRVYSAADRIRLKLILRGKRLGLSLDDSRDIIDMYEPGKTNVDQLKKLIDAIQAQRTKLNQQLDDITNLLKDLNQAESDCIESLKTNGQK
ncbi:MerR family DNA-binding transcriptional regulator [bacterium]|jgi:DNA-binding transcriptional MerR regulator|nr:MerR family DNA-binding transcriptional regulator [Porticoccaceae bacterium]MDB4322206.1 MerR family DNA-binding transcriptional regulator [bacterium]MDB9952827.1 MerR family DNA-binding transcriptional regulator [Porticoccaceae bacterium]MDB9999292.1 MerR family DNA-binding transcriptional regulator [Porticoccaceae bacterium]